MAKVPSTTEAARMIRTCEKKNLIALHKINQDKELRDGLIALLNQIFRTAEADIGRSAGVVKSMDSMIGIAISQAFDKGRISAAVLIHTLIKNSSEELEKRESKK